MKKLVIMALAVGLTAVAANATSVDFAWKDGQPWDQNRIMAPSDTAEIDIVVTLDAGDSVVGWFHANEPVDNIAQIGMAPKIPGWDTSFDPTNNDFLGAGNQQWAIGGPDNAAIVGPGVFVLGNQTIHLTSADPPGKKEIVIDAAKFFQLIQAGGAFMTYSSGAGGYAGYYELGVGSPGIAGPYGSDPRMPLTVEKVPEPASLSLLALGGLALLRRRR